MNEQKVKTEKDLILGLSRPVIPINPVAAEYRETTSTLCQFIVDMFANSFKIAETDHAFVYPVRNKQNQIVGFNLNLYFNTRGNNQNKNIWRVSGAKAQNNNGRPDLMALAGARMSDGGFKMSDTFKQIMCPISAGGDNKIEVKADINNRDVAVIECDFFAVLAMCLDIKSDDNYDFTILSCDPVRDGQDSLDYLLSFRKEISGNNRKGKRGYDYADSDRYAMRTNGRR